MLLLLALASLLSAEDSSAAPLRFLEGRASSDTCKDIDNCRRLFDIVWGCFVTVFACTWVSVHPNVPRPKPFPPPKDAALWRQVKWRLVDAQGALRSRFKLMLVALLGPEFIAGFAAKQLVIAWKFSTKYDVSLMHGFFIGMGGFVDSQGHPIVTVAQIEQPEVLPAIRRTTEAAIEDKSKGDPFSKGIAFLQGLWFVVQCIARTAQHLPLSELEVATLAFAVVNVFTWLLWWAKPLDVQDPIVVEVAPKDDSDAMAPQQKQTWWTT
ncbi:hypothetical protein C8F01DRAFT_1179662, partial [Mycena amicta]